MLPYSEYGRQDGSGFSSAASVKAYLYGEFAKFNSLRPHTHVIADVSGLQGALDGKQASGSYAPLSHVMDTNNPHAVTKAQVGLGNADNTSDVNKPVSTAVQTALNGKANASHTHVISDVTGLQTALDGKAATSHTHTIAQVTGLQAALDGKLSTAVTPSTPTRSIGTAFQPSTTKAVLCIYSVKTQVTNPLLVGTSTCTVRLLSDAASLRRPSVAGLRRRQAWASRLRLR
ncbi:hypothetical protein AB5I41_01460 [Sphingomonas sp. MMS24-JH45]